MGPGGGKGTLTDPPEPPKQKSLKPASSFSTPLALSLLHKSQITISEASAEEHFQEITANHPHKEADPGATLPPPPGTVLSASHKPALGFSNILTEKVFCCLCDIYPGVELLGRQEAPNSVWMHAEVAKEARKPAWPNAEK
ncbi:hypothetical protein CapIbe_017789 [Capra ibex]